jgi:3-oxoacyl-[acyl-carrier protein] reductase
MDNRRKVLSFVNKTVIITGGLHGIGFETAKLFLKRGADVGIIDYCPGKITDAEPIVEELHNINSDARVCLFNSDVSDLDALKNAVDRIRVVYPRVDVLINNAGITRDSSLKKMTVEMFDKVLNVNLKGLTFCVKYFAESMIEEHIPGVILNASSVVAINGNFGQSNYVCSKAAVSALTLEWAKEYGGHGIRVNAVAPGFTKTGMTERIPKKIVERITSNIPLGRFAFPKEIAETYAFLASSTASYITGTVLQVDGGLVLGGLTTLNKIS